MALFYYGVTVYITILMKKNKIRNGIKEKRREESVAAGAYDGRFAPRTETPKTRYKRKPKHRSSDLENEE